MSIEDRRGIQEFGPYGSDQRLESAEVLAKSDSAEAAMHREGELLCLRAAIGGDLDVISMPVEIPAQVDRMSLHAPEAGGELSQDEKESLGTLHSGRLTSLAVRGVPM